MIKKRIIKNKTLNFLSILFSAIIIVIGFVYLAQSFVTWAFLDKGIDPIAYWKFDEGIPYTCADNYSLCEEKGWNAAYEGNKIWEDEDECIAGSCLYLDGTGDYGVLYGDLGNPSAMTVDFWFRKPNINAGPQYIADARYAGDTDNWSILQDYTAGSCTSTNGNICFMSLVEIPTSMLSNNTWYHVAITADVSSTNMYLNGELVATGAGNDPDFGVTFTIGARYSTDTYFAGNIDEFKNFDYVRTTAQIMASYTAGAGAASPSTGAGAVLGSNNGGLSGNSPILRLALNEGTETTAYSKTTANNGTLNNMETGDWVTTGQRWYGLSFGGTDERVSHTAVTFTSSQPWSSTHWIYWPTSTRVYDYYIGQYAANNGLLLRYVSTNTFTFRNSSGTYYPFTAGSSAQINNRLAHLALVYDGAGNLSLYIDGSLYQTLTSVTGSMVFDSIG